MTIQHQPVPPHLNYFLCIEDDLLVLSRYIEFCQRNENVHSLELARLLMAAAAEADVVAKALCKRIDPISKADKIHKYQSELLSAYPMLPSAVAEMPRFGMSFTPWTNWSRPKESPEWWQGYNGIKHHRAKRFEEANLKNALNATAGLLILLVLLYGADQAYLFPAPKLFVPHTFAAKEGEALRLFTPDGANVPWA